MMNGTEHMRTNNFILKNTGCLSKEYCKDLINFFDKNESIAEKGIAGSKRLNDLEIAINVHQFSDNLLICLNNTVEKYKKKFPLIDTQLDRWQIDKIAQLAIRTCGGQAMLKSLALERIFRDSRCGSLMLPWTAEICLDRIGKTSLYNAGEKD